MNPTSALAIDLGPQLFAAILIPLGLFSFPMMAILTRHQRQMAEIIHGRQHEDLLRAEVEELRAELFEVKSQLRALNPGSQTGGTTEDLKHRLG